MIEIVVVIVLVLYVGKTVKEKGRRPLGYQLMTVALWIGGEFLGGIIGAIILMTATGGEMPSVYALYVFAVAGAAVGGLAAYLIARGVSPIAPPAVEHSGSPSAGAAQSGMAASSSPAVAPAGWYQDPTARYELRYWDGWQWSDAVSLAGVQYEDRLSMSPSRNLES